MAEFPAPWLVYDATSGLRQVGEQDELGGRRVVPGATMNEVLSDAVTKKLSAMMEALGGASALYGDPVILNGEEIVPVARISVIVGGIESGARGGVTNLSRNASEPPVRMIIESVGFLQSSPDGPVFCAID